MTEHSRAYGAGPHEARPLPHASLAAPERDLIRRIYQRLREIAENARSCGPREWRWARIDDDPRGRVMVIHGTRGSGKTSLLLTVLKELRQQSAAFGGPFDNDSPPDGTPADGVPTGIRPLDILDFDPLPEKIPLHAWLIQAWLPLVEFLEAPRNFAGDASLAHGAAGPLPGQIQSAPLRERWEKLREQAIVGWAEVSDGRSVVDRLFDHSDQLVEYQVLRDEWQAWVDQVFERLIRVDPLARVILVPIDDVDLQVQRNVELIHATRLLRHPRVVYVATADLEHTERIVFAAFEGRHRALCPRAAAEMSSLPSRWPGPEDSDRLARSVMQKAFPSVYVFRTSPVALSLLVSQEHGAPVRETLNLLTISSDGGAEIGLAEWLMRRASLPMGDEDLWQWRDLQRMIDRVEAEGRSERTARALLLDLLDLDGARGHMSTIESGHGAHVNFDLRGQLHVSANPAWYTGIPNVRITVGSEMTSRFLASDGARTANQTQRVPTALLAREMHESPLNPWTGTHAGQTARRGPVVADKITVDIGSFFAWTRWTNAPREAIFVWPFAYYPSIRQLREWSGDWAAATKKIRDAQNAAEKLAYAWIWFQQRWVKEGIFNAPIDWGGDPSDKEWRDLLSLAANSDGARIETRYWDQWFKRSLALFAAPEFGLPSKVQRIILTSVRDKVRKGQGGEARLQAWITDLVGGDNAVEVERRGWRGARHQSVMDAFHEARDEDTSDHLPNLVPLPSDDEGDALLHNVRAFFPDAPWYEIVEGSRVRPRRKRRTSASSPRKRR